MKNYILYLILMLASSCFGQQYIKYVNTFIGTAPAQIEGANNHIEAVNEVLGQTMPTVQLPNGMNSWTPQTSLTENKCISPYYYKDTTFYGFRASHWINGGCTQDYGSVTIMGLTGKLVCKASDRVALYKHEEETATPAYYSNYLSQYKLFNEMTATSHAAIFKFTPHQKDSLYIIVTPNSDRWKGYVEVDVEKKQIRGYNPVHKIYQGLGKEAGFNGYFVVQFDKNFTVYGTYSDESVNDGGKQLSCLPNVGAYIGFSVKKDEHVTVKCGTSFTSMEAAATNLAKEIPGWNFVQVRKRAEKTWNKHLSKLEVVSSKRQELEEFYSAFYRASLLPRTFNDVDGSYPSFGSGKTIEKARDFVYYDDFSAWDIYRAQIPLLNITDPEKISDMVESLLKKYEQGGWLPIFPCWNSYTSAMIGDHTIAIICDAFIKGTPIRNVEKVYEAMRKNAFEQPVNYEEYASGKGRRSLTSYLKYGYIPLEDPVKEAFHKNEQVSRTLEYAYDDFVLSQVAKKLGKQEDYKKLSVRALNYKNVIDPVSGYARGRYENGSFIEKFKPFEKQQFITEGYPIHYTWYVPHDPKGLMVSMGGKEVFISKLDSLFDEKLYWHGNEPSHQIAYLYNWVGQPWKTQFQISEILKREYKNKPGGLSGNDDAGQMSAWYVFSAIGFYPVCPGTTQYAIGTPKYTQTTVNVSKSIRFVLKARNVSDKNIYIQSALLNGKPYDKTFIEHSDIIAGGLIEFQMGDCPSKWGSKVADVPYSFSK